MSKWIDLGVRNHEEQRRSPRHVVDPGIWVGWLDARGAKRRMRGRCLDVSAGGIRVFLHQELEPGKEITVGVPSQRMVRKGVVRHCRNIHGWCAIGIQFPDHE